MSEVNNNTLLYLDYMPWMMEHLVIVGVVVTLMEQEVVLKVDTFL